MQSKLVNSEEDASMALQVSNALTQALLSFRIQNMAEVSDVVVLIVVVYLELGGRRSNGRSQREKKWIEWEGRTERVGRKERMGGSERGWEGGREAGGNKGWEGILEAGGERG